MIYILTFTSWMKILWRSVEQGRKVAKEDGIKQYILICFILSNIYLVINQFPQTLWMSNPKYDVKKRWEITPGNNIYAYCKWPAQGEGAHWGRILICTLTQRNKVNNTRMRGALYYLGAHYFLLFFTTKTCIKQSVNESSHALRSSTMGMPK